jgi:hypothetical protein
MAQHIDDDDPVVLWPAPDLSILESGQRSPPPLPLEVFGEAWRTWIIDAALAAAAPVDYVAMPLLASTSALIGNARWPQAVPGWAEPPHLWLGVVGKSGNGKSPGADCLMRTVLPEIEHRMERDFPDQQRDWQTKAELSKAKQEAWKSQVRDAQKAKRPAPEPPTDDLEPEPQSPRLRQFDVTVEKVAALLGTAAPKGLLICRDELAGWIEGMRTYNDAGRAFWLEAFGGRPYRVERQKLPQPIKIPRLAVAVYGGTQPDKLARWFEELDDGLMARFLWAWPEPVEFRLGTATPNTDWAVAALDRLRELDLAASDPPQPIMVPIVGAARPALEEFGRAMQRRQAWASGLLASAYGKARGLALRLSLILEYLWWCAEADIASSPREISEAAVAAALGLMGDYFMPMAERVYGDVALPEGERLATVLAKWLFSQSPMPKIVNAREIQRLKLPGICDREKVGAAIEPLLEADWLRPAPSPANPKGGRRGADYAVNPRLKMAAKR